MSILNMFSLVMIVVYFSIGIFILFNPASKFGFSNFSWVGIGVITIAYGLFRMYTLYRRRKEREPEEDEIS